MPARRRILSPSEDSSDYTFPSRSRSRRRGRSLSRRRERSRSPYRRQRSGSRGRRSFASSASLGARESARVRRLLERMDEGERIIAKLEKKEKEREFKFSKPGCEKQYRFNSKIRELIGDKLRFELQKHFRGGVPDKMERLIKEVEKEIDDQNHKLKIADEFGFRALDDFDKEDLARDDKEEKILKALRKEKERRDAFRFGERNDRSDSSSSD